MALDIVGWHDRTTSDHQQELNTWAAKGYRTISLSVYGDRNNPLYAAVMIKRAQLVAEKQHFGMDAATWQATFNQMAAQGWGPLIVTATGPADNPLFAASWFEVSPIPLTRHAMTAAEFNAQNQQAIKNGQILHYADAYGDPGDLRYVAIWVANTDNLAWNCDGIDDQPAMVQERFNALTSGFARPTHSAETPHIGQVSLYDDSTAGNWVAHGNMTSAGYQQFWKTLWPQGQRVLRVDGKGSGSSTRFTAIWGTEEGHHPRTFRMSGSPGIAAIDDEVKTIMTANVCRGASLAITSGTRLVYARGYTYAEPDYPDVQPTTMFRQASVSKFFCAAAIWQLIEAGTLHLSDLLHDKLPLTPPGGSLASNWNQITLRDLLEMTAGITTGIGGTDPNVSSTLPISAIQMANWLSGQPLGNTPGDKTQAKYSNASYMLLGLLIAKLRGKSTFIDGIGHHLLAPLHITHTRAATTLANHQPAGEARYHSRPLQTANSVMVTGQPLCALGYGESNLENGGGAGGLSASAVDVARLVACLSMTSDSPLMKHTTLMEWLQAAATASSTLSGPPEPGAHGYHGFDGVNGGGTTFSGDKGGSLSTSQNGFWFTTGGIGIVLCWNTPVPNGPQWYPNDSTILTAAQNHDWGTADLFASTYEMPSLTPAVPLKAPLPPFKPVPAMTGSHMKHTGRPTRI
jgi:CubicO group peptidase (beta-lactamase class C family)